jgi:glutathione S-transferase
MIDLYQFELSHYTEKIRFILDYKGLPYRKIEVTPGIGQLEIYQLSGQRQVPVIKDGTSIVSDSTAIALYLDKKYPDRPIIPSDPKLRGLCLMMEEWADESIGLNARKAMIGAFSQDPAFRTAFLPPSVPSFLKTLLGTVPHEALDLVNFGIGFGPDVVKAARNALSQDLEALTLLLANSPYLVTAHPTLADFAVAGLSMYIKFPDGPYLDLPASLKGKGVPGLADNSAYAPFFAWRDRLYQDVRQSTNIPGSSSAPQSITIE